MTGEWKSRARSQTAAPAKWHAALLQFLHHAKAHTLSFSLKFHEGSWHSAYASATWKTQPQYFSLIQEEKQRQKHVELFVLIHQLLTNERPTWCHLLFYFTSYVLNMFRTLIYPSSGACDYVGELPHQSSCSQFVVCRSFGCGWYLVVFVLQASACKTKVK